ncbi:MAG: RNA polymerase sigma-54 factor [Acidobacteria bacterium CG_4_9_14_3_um_filter_49_7]|nr:MAG: RNA polymerase sigma-54 factor [Acidobacteria bacterium CG_4_9_14_3_um_filter_49_7]
MALFEQKLNLKLTQKLTLTPALQQAIKLLQMTVPELQDEIREELVSNPLLEDVSVSDSIAEQTPQEHNEEVKDDFHSDELDLEEYFKNAVDDQYIPSSRSTRTLSEANDFSYENFVSKPISLYEHLEWQLQMNLMADKTLEIAKGLLRYLDEDGYLKSPPEADDLILWFAEEMGTKPETVQSAIEAIQDLDPTGVGARSLEECLWLQVKQLGFESDEILRRLIEHYLHDIGDQKYNSICTDLGLDSDELSVYIAFIRKLEPKPGRKFSTSRPQYIVPDVFVYRVGDEYQIQLNDDGLPHLRVNRSYSAIVTNKSKLNPEQQETRRYVKEKLKSAIWIIRSIQNRQHTILKVARSIVTRQREFLDYGVERMRPLTLREVAEDIGMHESTVARVVKNKYMHTPRGLFEFRFFFNARITSTNGEDVSSLAVKEKIKKIVETESQQKPYSDTGIANILKAHGIDIARRTIAKYREELGIVSSSERKKIYRRSNEH